MRTSGMPEIPILGVITESCGCVGMQLHNVEHRKKQHEMQLHHTIVRHSLSPCMHQTDLTGGGGACRPGAALSCGQSAAPGASRMLHAMHGAGMRCMPHAAQPASALCRPPMAVPASRTSMRHEQTGTAACVEVLPVSAMKAAGADTCAHKHAHRRPGPQSIED